MNTNKVSSYTNETAPTHIVLSSQAIDYHYTFYRNPSSSIRN